MDDYQVAVKAVRTALLANSTLNAAIGGRVYRDLAPAGFSYPYIVITENAAGDDNSAQNVKLPEHRLLVKVVGTNADTNGTLSGLIYTALHEATLTAESPWTIYKCNRIQPIHLMEVDAQVAYWHDGGIYRVRMSA